MLNAKLPFKTVYLSFLQFYEDEFDLLSKGKVVFTAAIKECL